MIRVLIGKQRFLERHGDDQQAEQMLFALPACRREIGLAAGKANLAGLFAIDERSRVGIHILGRERDPAPGPIAGNLDFALDTKPPSHSARFSFFQLGWAKTVWQSFCM